MSRLPTTRKILTEDLKSLPPEVLKGIQPMIDTVNSFMGVVYQGFNKNISFSDNVSCFIKELTYRTPPTYPTMESVSFISELKGKATGVILMQALERTTYTPVTGSAVYVPWAEIAGSIVIYPIQGLAADKSYIIRLLIT